MKKSWLINSALVLVTLTLGCLGIEYTFRWMLFGGHEAFAHLRNPTMYAPIIKQENEDFRTADYWKLHNLFKGNLSTKLPQELLGWNGFFNKETLVHVQKAKQGKRQPVLFYGDSFAMCVDTVDCFEDILNADSTFAKDHFLMNYGVGGFGSDQIYLLFNETVNEFNDPFVVFSLLTTDMDRSMLAVRERQKPYFEVSDTGLVLKGTPITQSPKAFFEENPPDITSYLWNKFKYSDISPFEPDHKLPGRMRQEEMELNTLLLEKAFRKLKKQGENYVVVIFYPEHHKGPDWRLTFLRDLCAQNDVPYICDMDLMHGDTTATDFRPGKYNIIGDGHPTSHLNRLLSMELKKYILHPKYRQEVAERNAHWKTRFPSKRVVSYYEQTIRNSPDWLLGIQQSAEKQGRPLDSLILENAVYMAN